jgi:glycosyltransferase involved in cell wall biosynthesis
MVDSMGLNFSRRVVLERGLKRIAFDQECRRVSAYEVKVAQLATHAFVVSAVDQQFIGQERVRVLPLGIDQHRFFRDPDGLSDPIIVFTGNMNYKPNVDAVLWYYKQCWGDLKLAVPGVRWLIAGGNPTAAVVAVGTDPSITVTGRVTSLADVINAARVSIAPMQMGSGMQFKILEAMACGVPVVTTSLGLGDIGAKPGQDVLLAETPEDFNQSVMTLLQSSDLRQTIGDAGLHYINKNHTWDVLNAEFELATFATLEK